MPSYLVETYVPRQHVQDAFAAGQRARAAAQQLSEKGAYVHYLRTMFVPDDETCFHVFEAQTEQAVGEACRLAGITSGRIVVAVE